MTNLTGNTVEDNLVVSITHWEVEFAEVESLSIKGLAALMNYFADCDPTRWRWREQSEPKC